MIDGAAIITHIDEVEKRINERFNGLENRMDTVVRTAVTKEDCTARHNDSADRRAIAGLVLKGAVKVFSVGLPVTLLATFWQSIGEWLGSMGR